MPINVANTPTLNVGLFVNSKIMVSSYGLPMLIQYYGGSTYADAQEVANNFVRDYMYNTWYGKSVNKYKNVIEKKYIDIKSKKEIFPNIEKPFVIELGGVFQEVGGEDEDVGGSNQKMG